MYSLMNTGSLETKGHERRDKPRSVQTSYKLTFQNMVQYNVGNYNCNKSTNCTFEPECNS
jgi:hypothetical protein